MDLPCMHLELLYAMIGKVHHEHTFFIFFTIIIKLYLYPEATYL